MSTKRRGWLIGCGAALLLGGGCVSYPIGKIAWSRRTVDAFCAEVAVGTPVAGLAAKARGRWLEVIEVPAHVGADGTSDPAVVMIWQGWVFARRFCSVEHADGKVTNKHGSSLD